MNVYKKVSQTLMVAAGLLYAGVMTSGSMPSLKDMGENTTIYLDNQTGEDIYYAFKGTNKAGKWTPIYGENIKSLTIEKDLFLQANTTGSHKIEVIKANFPALKLTNIKDRYATLYVSNAKIPFQNFLKGTPTAADKKLVTSKLVPLPKKKCDSYTGDITFTVTRSSKVKTTVGGKVLSISVSDNRQCND